MGAFVVWVLSMLGFGVTFGVDRSFGGACIFAILVAIHGFMVLTP